MNEQDVKNLIEAFIIANGVNAITADVLRPILIAMLTQPNDEIGDLTQLNTVTQDNLVDAINEIYNSISTITNDGIKLYQGDANPNVEPPDSYNIADFYFEEGNDLWQFNGVEWVRANSIFLQNSGYKETKFPYVGSLNFTIPENVQAIIVKKNGNPTENKENWSQLGNVVTYLGTMEAGDYLLITGVYVIPSDGGGGFIPTLNDVTSQGSSTSVTIQSPDAVNANDLVNLGQLENGLSLISSGFKGVIDLTTPSPTESGLYQPTESGTYTNFGGIVVDLSEGYTTISFDGVNYGKQVNSISVYGTVESGNTSAVSGGEVFEKTINYARDTDLVIGKNKADTSGSGFIEGFYVNNSTGLRSTNASSTILRIENIEANTIYTISGRSASSGARASLVCFNSLGTKLKPLLVSGVEATTFATEPSGNTSFKTPIGTVAIELTVSFTEGLTTYKNTIQFEKGSVATSYQAYQETSVIKKTLIPDYTTENTALITSLIKPEAFKSEKSFEVYINGNESRVRSYYSNNYDIVWRMLKNVNPNNCYNFLAKGLLTKSDAITSNGILMPNAGGDDATPVIINNMYIGANHGNTCLRTVTATSHGKTLSDVGSVWKNSSLAEFVLLKIVDANTLWFSSYDQDGFWTFLAIGTGTLTHFSGANNTASIVMNSAVSAQLYPSVSQINSYYLLDDDIVTDNGTYRVIDAKYIEEYDIIDAGSMITNLVANKPIGGYLTQPTLLDGDAIATVRNVFDFINGGALIKNEVAIKKLCNFGSTGIVQNAYYKPSWSSAYTRLIPYSKSILGYDFRIPLDFTGVFPALNFTTDYWYNSNTPPSRYVDRISGGSLDVVFNMGYLPVLDGINREDNVDNSFFLNSTKKSYPNLVTAPQVSGNNNAVFSGVAFRIHQPKNTDFYNYLNIESEGKLYLILDFAVAKNHSIVLDKKWLGKEVKVFKKTDNVYCLSKLVNGKLDIKVTDITHYESIEIIIG